MLGELEKERMTMVKTFTSWHCYSKGITVQSKGALVSGTLGLLYALKESLFRGLGGGTTMTPTTTCVANGGQCIVNW
jgi:hypothetical protein